MINKLLSNLQFADTPDVNYIISDVKALLLAAISGNFALKSSITELETSKQNKITSTAKIDYNLLSGNIPISVPTTLSSLTDDSGHRTVSDTLKYTWNSKANVATTLTGYGITDAYTKSEVDSKVASVYKYKGSKTNYSDLPTTGNITGDVWNIVNADPTHGILAGDNVAWNGSGWDRLAGTVDLSNYQTKITSSNKLSYNLLSDTPTIPATLASLSDDTSHRLVTDTLKYTWNNKANTSDIPVVYDWAKASTKPSYTYTLVGAAAASHTHNYAGASSAGGTAFSAEALTTSTGSATQPVYFYNGKPTACTYTVAKSVPSDAQFTDTVTTIISITGSGNVITSITTSNGALTITKGITALTEHQSLAAYAPLYSPGFTGTPTAPTADASTNSTQVATTAFVHSIVNSTPVSKGTVTGTWSVANSVLYGTLSGTVILSCSTSICGSGKLITLRVYNPNGGTLSWGEITIVSSILTGKYLITLINIAGSVEMAGDKVELK